MCTFISFQVSCRHTDVIYGMKEIGYTQNYMNYQFGKDEASVLTLPYDTVCKDVSNDDATLDLIRVVYNLNKSRNDQQKIILNSYKMMGIQEMITLLNNKEFKESNSKSNIENCKMKYMKNTQMYIPKSMLNMDSSIPEPSKQPNEIDRKIARKEAIDFAKWLLHTDNGTLHHNPHTNTFSDSIGFCPSTCFNDGIYTVEELHSKWKSLTETKQ